MCLHLQQLENELKKTRIKEIFRGKAWGKNCNEWIYFECILDTKSIMNRLQLDACVIIHSNDDPKSGLEKGLFCSMCKDAIIGIHPSLIGDKLIFK